MPEALYIYSIPKITIQPLVENALYHGIKNKRGMGHISIRGEAGEKDFTIRDGDRIAQVVITKYEQATFELSESLDNTERGAGGFGHTGV